MFDCFRASAVRRCPTFLWRATPVGKAAASSPRQTNHGLQFTSFSIYKAYQPMAPLFSFSSLSLHKQTETTRARRARITSRWDSSLFPVPPGEPSVMVEECCSSSPDSFREAESGTPLSAVAEAFEELARSIEGGVRELRLGPFSDACSLVSVLFGCLGFAFKFAEMEYVSKVNDLLEASKTYDTLHSIVDTDVKHDSVRKQGSHSRNLRRVRLGLDLIKALFEQFLSSDECSLREAASTAYTQVCAPYHTWAIRKAVGAGMYALPSRDELLLRLNENDHSVQKEMRRYIVACNPIIQYVDNIYLSRNISLDW